ncbi:hypothetical protein JVU11DRAFT_9134 [Chiua virens]|nr:hypothetical protein JVU11DRAFT_9134 [Chiua virens]
MSTWTCLPSPAQQRLFFPGSDPATPLAKPVASFTPHATPRSRRGDTHSSHFHHASPHRPTSVP